ncbi:MAG: DUF4350 domain-containing protein [Pseudomonadota bacterium]
MSGAAEPRTARASAPRDRGEGGFNIAVVIGVVLTASLLFAAALYASLSGREGRDPGDERAPSSQGVTAIGLGAFATMLEELGRDVEHDAEQAGRGAIIVISDARTGTAEQRERLLALRYRHHSAESVLLILPKWRLPRRAFGRRFAQEVDLAPRSAPTRAIDAALDALGSFTNPSIDRRDGALPAPRRNTLGLDPEIETAQVMRSEGLAPLIAVSGGAMLLGEAEIGGDDGLPRLFILSDPDPLLNHGLDDGENAAFAARLIARLGPADAQIAFDDGPAPPRIPPNFWAALFEPPLIAVTFAILALFMVIGLIGLARFGGREPDRPGQAAGKDALLDASAALLRQGDGDRAVIRRFFDETLKDVGARLQAPDLSKREALAAWLTSLERKRAPSRALYDLETRVSAAAAGPRPTADALTALARDINAWREEMLRGHA